jgi:predicted nucleic acid-binding protein
MCIVIDANTFAHVFNSSSKNHHEFKPVLDWIVYGKGKIVYGGTLYKKELRNAPKYFKLFLELSKSSKVVEVDMILVDKKEQEVAKLVNHPNFDDPHLIAIIIVSGCKLICSHDSKAYSFLKR